MVKSYYACNIELDKAVGLLMEKLEEAGIADKTVIAITPDHYPYGLEDGDNENTKYKYFDYLAGHTIDRSFELYKSNFILYCPEMTDSVTVTKYCSSLDVLPTLLNLFGFEYDSRLLMGRDIFSSSDGLVIFADQSFITEKGKYNAQTDEFTLNAEASPFKNEAEQEKYLKEIKTIVNNKTQVSALILDTDYYAKVFNK
jgi:phosphoglycerol transferase MdoB-like AlkP superfamily enzyme